MLLRALTTARSSTCRAVPITARYLAQNPPGSAERDHETTVPSGTSVPSGSNTNATPDAQGKWNLQGDLPSSTPLSSFPLSEPPSGSSVPSLDFSPPEPAKQGAPTGQTGAKPARGRLSHAERRRRNMGRATLAGLGVAFGCYTVYLGRQWNEDELKAKKIGIKEAPSTRWGRTQSRFVDIFDYFNKPAWPELLPPPYPPPHGKPYTLLLSIDDLLVTSMWDRQHGWRTAKRPGVDYFLAYISQFYEVVVFTTQNYYTALPILEKLDRYNFYVTHKLFREATRSINGKIVKDLSYLNRDLSKVILLDTNAEHVSTHPENAVVIPKWKGDSKDSGLIAMIPFLESIAIYKPADVRPILQAYAGKDVPLEYAKKESEAKEKHIEEWKQKKGVSTGSFRSVFGLSSSAPSAPRTLPSIPPTYLEQKRHEAQMQYREEQKYIAQHRDELERLLKQEQEALASQTPGSLLEAFDHMKGGAAIVEKQTTSGGSKTNSTPSTAAF